MYLKKNMLIILYTAFFSFTMVQIKQIKSSVKTAQDTEITSNVSFASL